MRTPFFFLFADEETLCTALRARALGALRREVVDDLDPATLAKALLPSSSQPRDVWFARMTAAPPSATPPERGLFWAVPTETAHWLADASTGTLSELARDACAARHTLFYCLVDPGIFDLVLDLYAAGHPTSAGCQGRFHEAHFSARRHEPHAYLAFEDAPMPEHVQRALVAGGMKVYADGRAVCAVDIHVDGSERPGSVRGYRRESETRAIEDFQPDAIRAVLAANAEFVPRMRRAFALRPK
jgi:hypothetical protein